MGAFFNLFLQGGQDLVFNALDPVVRDFLEMKEKRKLLLGGIVAVKCVAIKVAEMEMSGRVAPIEHNGLKKLHPRFVGKPRRLRLDVNLNKIDNPKPSPSD